MLSHVSLGWSRVRHHGAVLRGAPASPAVTLCPFLPGMMADNLAASVGCEDAPLRGTRLHWEKLGEFSKLILYAQF